MSERTETTLAQACTEITYGDTESAKLEKIGPSLVFDILIR